MSREIITLEHCTVREEGIFWIIELKKYANRKGQRIKLESIGMELEEIIGPDGDRVPIRYYYPKGTYPGSDVVPRAIVSAAEKIDSQIERDIAKARKVMEDEGLMVGQTEEKEPEKKEEKKSSVFRF